MSQRDAGGTSGPDQTIAFDPDRHPALFDAVLSRRIIAFFVDAVIIVLLMVPAALVVFVLGLVTFGLAWFLYPALFALVALGYVGLTLGGPVSATVGMRLAGLQMRTRSGGHMFPLLAVMHALVFWFSVAILTPLVLLVGLFSWRKRLLHDMLVGTIVVNAEPLRRMEA